jgi:1-acyl-sn-glycerol-3-phosphate acyltransferase
VQLFLHKKFGQLSVLGQENFPQTGACIIAPVHRSMADIPVVGLAAYVVAHRRAYYIGKEELWHIPIPKKLTLNRQTSWEVPILGRGFTACGGIPITKNQELSPTAKTSIDTVLSSGGATVVFPEGTRRKGPEIQRRHLHRGAVALALEHGASIVPIGISGTESGSGGGGPVGVAVAEPMLFEALGPEAVTDVREFVATARPLLDELHERMNDAQRVATELRGTLL